MPIGKIQTEQQLLDFIREELIGTLPERLEQVIGLMAGLKSGSESHAMPAATSGSFTIAHGVGKVPKVAGAWPDGATANDLTVGITNLTDTAFTVTWRRASGTNSPTPITWYWLAM